MTATYTKKKPFRGMKNLSQSLNAFTKPIFNKRGFSENKIVTDWNFIVGEEIGNSCTPKKISFYRDKRSEGTLHLEVYDSGTAMEMTYMEPIIIEKIASYFGYKAIAKLKIIQRPGGQIDIAKNKTIPTRSISNEKKLLLDEYLTDIDDEELKKALSNLGSDVMSDV